jgi:DnaJ-class molecular chaperone
MQGFDPGGAWSLHRLTQAELNAPRLCRACGGLGTRRNWLLLTWRECKACHGTGGAVDDERAWWRSAR